jgi:two-component system alkaline phosphatase synthesis response regulator PhoP
MNAKLRTKRILIVEDEIDAARLLFHHLKRRGYECNIAVDGRAALNAAFTHKPDLVILDLMLPTLHGYEVCRLLKDNPMTQHIPIVILTAMFTSEEKLRGFKLGADDYITKPFEMRELLARVAVLLRREKETEANAREICASQKRSYTD